ncbi:hypothetical protein JCM16303_001232 [Sporobolomyces ruberrimus]
MLIASTLVLTLFGTVLAVPASDLRRRDPTEAISKALQLAKRQSSSSSTAEAISSLQDLLGKVVGNTSGKCSSECSGWVDGISECTELDDYTQVGICACGDERLSAMDTCGDCYGIASGQDADNFASFCRENLDAISSLSTAPGGSSTSSAGSVGSGSRTATATGAPQSSTTSVGSNTETTTQKSASAQLPQESATGQNAPGSGAGTVKVGAGIVAGVVGGIAFALMA